MRETMDFAAMGANLGRQLTGSMGAYDQSYSRMAQQLAQQGAFQSQANLNNEKANQLRQRGQFQTPEFAGKIAAGFAGLTEPQAAEIEGYMKRGNWGENVEQLPADVMGPPLATPKAQPSFATPETLNKYNVGRTAHMMNLGGTGNTNAEQMADVIGKLLGQGRIDTVIADPSKAAALGKAMAANQGKALFHQGANGVMDQFTGAENLNDVGRSAAMENRAQANNANASAAQHLASRDLTKSKIGQPVVNPDGSVTTPTGKPIKLSATAEKELFEADDNVKAGHSTVGLLKQALDLNDKAYSGYFAKGRAVARSNLPGESEQANATINLDNIMTTQALESLKSTFGAAPTEGERKILLDIQASADKTPKQRKEIIERAMKAAENRLIFNTNKAKALRNGTHNVIDPQGQGGDADIDALLKKYGG